MMCSRKLKKNCLSSMRPDAKQPTMHISGDHGQIFGGAGDSSTIRMADIADNFSDRCQSGESILLSPPAGQFFR
jgi:hypothetical protein